MPEVQVLEAVTRSIPVFTEYIGETYGQADVEIITRVDGPITGIHFQEGQQVSAGQLLYTVDDPIVINARQAAQAQLTAHPWTAHPCRPPMPELVRQQGHNRAHDPPSPVPHHFTARPALWGTARAP